MKLRSLLNSVVETLKFLITMEIDSPENGCKKYKECILDTCECWQKEQERRRENA